MDLREHKFGPEAYTMHLMVLSGTETTIMQIRRDRNGKVAEYTVQ